MRLPGRCIVCGTPVIWTGKSWRNGGLGKGMRHVCPADRAMCGAWMPVARERCARRPHTYDPDRGGAIGRRMRSRTRRAQRLPVTMRG